MEIVLATQNPDKVREIKEVLKDLPIKILTLMDLGLKEKVEETGKTLEENALLKAKFWAEKTGKWALADDTGLEVEALNGAPGVHTS
ncbi:MAG TPA: non-canonical purine NTP pyrophosphatase, partial [bacterium]|nr:non-canonical purine NTP pyrophosphatase [bacterium]HEX67721.1 non-canonical purine NTP pyrophosphatase [bacterium]